MMSQVIYGILWAATIALTGVIAKWWRDNKDDEYVHAAFIELQAWADIAVRAAEDMGCALEMTGEEKLRYAKTALQGIRDKIELEITDEQIDMLVRAAYQTFASEAILIDGMEPVEDECFLDGVEDGE